MDSPLDDNLVSNVDTIIFHMFIEYNETTSLAAIYYAAKEGFLKDKRIGETARTSTLTTVPCWSDFLELLPDSIFCRMFQMEKLTVLYIAYKI